MKKVIWVGLALFVLGLIAAGITWVISYRTGKSLKKTFAVIDGIIIIGVIMMGPAIVRVLGPTP